MPEPDGEWLRAEYQAFNDRWQNGVVQRRVGLAFFTGVQGAILTVVGNQLGSLDTQGYALVVFGLIVSLVAWNNERRIGAYMTGYRERALEIEETSGLSLITKAKERSDTSFTFSNRRVFQAYYFIMLMGWILILAVNLFSGPADTNNVAHSLDEDASTEVEADSSAASPEPDAIELAPSP